MEIPLNCSNCISTGGCESFVDDPYAYMTECAIRRCCKDHQAGPYGYGVLPKPVVVCDVIPQGITVRDFSREIDAAITAMDRCPQHGVCEVKGCDGECIPYDDRCLMIERGTVFISMGDDMAIRVDFAPEGPFVYVTDMAAIAA